MRLLVRLQGIGGTWATQKQYKECLYLYAQLLASNFAKRSAACVGIASYTRKAAVWQHRGRTAALRQQWCPRTATYSLAAVSCKMTWPAAHSSLCTTATASQQLSTTSRMSWQQQRSALLHWAEPGASAGSVLRWLSIQGPLLPSGLVPAGSIRSASSLSITQMPADATSEQPVQVPGGKDEPQANDHQPHLELSSTQQQQAGRSTHQNDCEKGRAGDWRRQQLFEELPLPGQLIEGLSSCNMAVATPVQAAALTPILSGRNALVQSPTGTGKTLAYLVPLLARLQPWVNKYKQGAQVLVLAPTQELCLQVVQMARRILPAHQRSVLAIIGGVNHVRQLQAVEASRPGLLVATPGRLLKVAAHLGMFKKVLAPPGPHHKPVLVLEEADKLLMMQDFQRLVQELGPSRPSRGGRPRPSALAAGSGNSTADTKSPMEQVLKTFQVILVSASIKPQALAGLASWMDTQPAIVVAPAPADHGLQTDPAPAGSPGPDAPSGSCAEAGVEDNSSDQALVTMLPGNLTHLMLGYHMKEGVLPSLKRCIQAYLGQGKKVLAFVGLRKRALEIQQKLQSKGLNVPYLHGDLQPAQRGLLLQKFNGGQQQVLLASDAFGLGLDFQGVDVVLQVEFLAASIRQYVHRAGRTGRMGSQGTVVSIIPYRYFKAHRQQLKALRAEPQEIVIEQQEGVWRPMLRQLQAADLDQSE